MEIVTFCHFIWMTWTQNIQNTIHKFKQIRLDIQLGQKKCSPIKGVTVSVWLSYPTYCMFPLGGTSLVFSCHFCLFWRFVGVTKCKSAVPRTWLVIYRRLAFINICMCTHTHKKKKVRVLPKLFVYDRNLVWSTKTFTHNFTNKKKKKAHWM